MNIEAHDKGSGKKEQITITNDKGRLSSDDIERMVKEAEEYKEEDQKIQEKMEAKNEFENLLFQTKSTIENEKIKEKLSEDEIKIINDKVNENQQWLVQDNLEVEDYSKKKDEFNVFVQPYMTKLYPNQGMEQGMGPGMEQGMGPGMDTSEPSIDEVD